AGIPGRDRRAGGGVYALRPRAGLGREDLRDVPRAGILSPCRAGGRSMDVRAWILAGLVGLVPSAGHGESALLREALAAMPEAALDYSRPDMFVFVDVQAVLAIGGDPFTSMAMTRAGLAGRLRPVDALRTVVPDVFVAGPGIALADIAGFSGYGQPPTTVSFWHFVAPETAA